MTDFDRIFPFSLSWETGGDKNGGYTNDPNDPGGETRWGISKGAHPELDILNLTLEQAAEVYRQHYWSSAGNQESCAELLPWPLNAVHFDCVMNVGNRKIAPDGTIVMHRRANMILQRALGVDDDGYIGPKTLAAVKKAEVRFAAREAISERDRYYDSRGLWANRYRKGWKRRTEALRHFLTLA